jgi:hypothetical protein
LTINASGTVTSGKCVDSDGYPSTVLSGKVTLKNDCTASGNLKLSNGYIITIQHGTLGKDKSYFFGVGRDNHGSTYKLDAAKK